MNQVASTEQPVAAKIAEAAFRRGRGSELAADAIVMAHHRAQLLATLNDLQSLVNRGASFDPFLEIGAGRAYRSGALAEHWCAAGVACDISLGWLTDAPVLAEVFGNKRVPDRVCCDASRLPFLDDTFAFVFAYRTLHHFPDPAPIVAEAHRTLLGGGRFYCNHEPVDSPFRRRLRSDRVLSEPPTRWQRLARRLHADKVFWDEGGPERAAGIIEARFDLDRWRAALAPFEVAQASVNRRLRFQVDMNHRGVVDRVAGLAGGNIEALCRKSDPGSDLQLPSPAGGYAPPLNWRDRLRCLDCGASPLRRPEANRPVRCTSCGRVYPCVDNVLVLLPSEIERALYPGIVHQGEA